jgi:hypothetical protein
VLIDLSGSCVVSLESGEVEAMGEVEAIEAGS